MQALSCPSRHALASLLALALVVRLTALVLGADGLSQDPDNYRGLAQNVLAHGVLGQGETPSAYRPPLYPLLLVPCVALGKWSSIAIGALHLALGMATVWGVDWLGRRWRLGSGAWCAAALTACDPILVHQTTQVMTETTAAFLATAALVVLSLASERPTARVVASAGACLALAALCRPTFLVMLACAMPFVVRRSPTWSSRARQVVIGLTAAGAVLAPWALRNQAQFGLPIVSTTHGGYTLWLGNNSSFYDFLRQRRGGEIWRAADFDAEVLNARNAEGGSSEVENDRREYAQAWREIRVQPWMFLYASLLRLGRFWGLIPHQLSNDESFIRRWGRYATGTWYALEFALAAVGLWWIVRQANVPAGLVAALLLAASFTAVHTVFWTDLRMRAPIAPFVALLAGAGMGVVMAAILHRKAFV
jgi:4-amino-4-deoxy-L-arabinose transferase-like glycosyltransferase